jgi:S1-C subfamily serine protease
MTFINVRLLGATLALLLCGSQIARAAEDAIVADFEQLAAAKADALVTVKFVLKVKGGGFMGGGDMENESEVTGIMIDPKGLVLCSNTQLSGFAAMMRRLGMGGDSTPTDIKVLIGDDTEGLEAKLLARDSDLDLAWIQIKDPGSRTFKHVDLAKSAKPKVGQRVLVLKRMGKYFDRVLVVGESRVGGIISKPRELYAGIDAGGFGTPVFLPNGDLVGISILQMPEADDEAGPMAMISLRSSMQDMMSGMILPASEVAKATERARTRPSEGEEAEGAKTDKEKDEE